MPDDPPFEFDVPPVLMVPRAKPARGRQRPGPKPAPIAWPFVSAAFQAGATVDEVAAAFGITSQHLRRRIKVDIGVDSACEIDRMRQVGRMELRMRQHALATQGAGSVPMLIWLGKQRLGQSDKVEQTGTGTTFLVVTKAKLTPAEWEAAWVMCAAGAPAIQHPAEGCAQ